MKRSIRAVSLTAIILAIASCGGGDGGRAGSSESNLSGTITSDGSSTVFPLTEAIAEEFGKVNPGVRVPVGSSGTGGGFKRFCAGEIDVSNASRPIKDSEKAICDQNGIEYVELPIAFDGLSVVVHPNNSFVTCLTVAELKKLWEPGSKVQRWSEVRAGFPDRPIKLYGAGTNSGTFDYFTEAIMGTAAASRADYTASEDDNVLVQGVSGDENGLGYFGYAYYTSNKDKVKLVQVDGGTGCVTPAPETIKSGQYKPLSRPLFIYVTRKAMARPEVQAFVRFYNEHATELVPEVGYVPMEANRYQENLGKIGAGATTTQ